MSGKDKSRNVLGKDSVKTKRPRTPVHFNGHQMAIVNASYYNKSDDIRCLAIFPFNINFEPIDEMTPLVCEIQSPDKLSLDHGMLPDIVPDTISNWHMSLGLPYGKKILGICWDQPRLFKALTALIDVDVDDIFAGWRDLQQYAAFLNDLAWDRGEKIPYPKNELGSTFKRAIKDEAPQLSDAAYSAFKMIDLYKYFLKRGYRL